MCYVVISGKFATKHKKYYCIKCHQNILNLVGNLLITKMTTSITIAAFQWVPSMLFKIDRNKNQKPFRVWDKEKGKYAKPLAKIQFTAIFLKQDMRRNVLPKFIEICMKTPRWGPCGWAPTWRPETNRNICHWVLLQKREFISPGTQEH